MDALWIGVFTVLLLGYFALEGMIIGAGMLMGRLCRTESERAELVSTMGRFFLASEVWLVAVIGVLYGAFPTLEGKVLAGLYPVVVTFVIAWVLRSAGLWFRGISNSAAARSLWDGAIIAGSWGMALLWGLALGTIATGLPTAPPGGVIDPWAALNPVALIAAVVIAAILALHGAAFAAAQLRGELAARAARIRTPLLTPLRTGLLAMIPAALVLVGASGALADNLVPTQTLTVLTAIAGPAIPLLALGQIWMWRTFWKPDGGAQSYL